jgi:AAA ATPase-like protein/TGS domain-containing protein/RelA/SpoT family protein
VWSSDLLDDRAWQESISGHLRNLTETAVAYAPQAPSLIHYRRVSRVLLERFKDLALARAGFLHGVDPSELSQLSEVSGVTDEITTILEERNRLRSIGGKTSNELIFADSEGAEVARQLVSNVLPLIRDGRSVVLFVIEQIDHLDGDGGLSEWTRSFRFDPRPLPRASQLSLSDHFLNMRVRIRFLRYVVTAAAEWFGLWPERNAALNLALLHEDRERFEQIVDAILDDHHDAESASQERVAFVRQRLDGASVDVRWEWYSIESIHRHLDVPPKLPEWTKRFDRLGCVTVICEDEGDCYATLAKLHSSGDFVDTAIRDYIGSPRASGYRALHTALSRKGARAGFPDLIPVHVMSAAGWQKRLLPSGDEQLKRISSRISRDEHRVLTVLAHDGRAVLLPLGSVVLNFVLKLHSHLLPRVCGATVNRRPADLLYPLHDGDVIWLDVGPTPQPLPEGWESHVPRETLPKIRKEFPRAYRKTLVQNGLRWLRAQLAPQGLDDVSDEELAEAVNSGAEEVLSGRQLAEAAKRGPEMPPLSRYELSEWIYRHFGSHDAMERGVKILNPAFDRSQALAIATRTIVHLRESPSVTPEYEIPAEYAGKFDETMTCEDCEPSSAEPRSATLDGVVLVIHRAQARCGLAGRLLRRPLRHTDRRQYFAVETANRADNIVEILSTFREHEVDVANIAARRLSAGWRVVRIGCDYVTADRRSRIEARLRAVPGVVRVTGPDQPPIPAIEDTLPPRSSDAPSLRRREPYQVGPPIDDDRLFYGMEAQLQKLTDTFDRVSKNDAGGGEFVFVTGPLRIGKTSVVKQFLRRLNRDLARPHLALYHMPSMARWSTVAAEIRNTFVDSIPHLQDELREQVTLEAMMRAIRNGQNLPLVLVIDEIVGLLHLNSQWPEEVDAFRNFQAAIRATPGVLVIWIGPALAVQRLDHDVAQLLTNSEQVVPSPFIDTDVDHLLRAVKMGPIHRITPAGNLAGSIRRLTEGNPYWVSHIARQMFSIEENRHGQQQIAYSYGTLKLAKEHLFLQPLAFHHHLSLANDESEKLKLIILRVLAGPKGENKFIARSDLLAALQRKESPSVISAAIEELYLAGSIRIENSRIKVAAPLLAEFIRHTTEGYQHVE